MSIEEQAEAALRAAQRKAARAKLVQNFDRFRFEIEYIERHRGQDEWFNRLSAVGLKGEVLRGLYVTVRTPGPLEFDRLYGWELLAVYPAWVEYRSPAGVVRWNHNTGPRPSR
jgi:hypothetical protein